MQIKDILLPQQILIHILTLASLHISAHRLLPLWTEFRLDSVCLENCYPWHYTIPLHDEIWQCLRHSKILQVCDMKGKFSPLWVAEGFMVWFVLWYRQLNVLDSQSQSLRFLISSQLNWLMTSSAVCRCTWAKTVSMMSVARVKRWRCITARPPLQRLIAGFTCGNVVTWSHRIGVTFSTYNLEHFYLEKKERKVHCKPSYINLDRDNLQSLCVRHQRLDDIIFWRVHLCTGA